MKKTGANYSAWDVKLSEFPKKAPIEEQIKFTCNFGILAPSIHNTQPWKFIIDKNILEIFPDWDFYLSTSDPKKRALYISLGTCVTNIESAANFFGFNTKVNFEKDCIKVIFNKTLGDRTLAKIAPAITKRYSNRLSYLNEPIPKEMLSRLESIKIDGISIKISNEHSVIDSAALLHQDAVKALANNKEFAKEMATWLRSTNSKSYDGMPGFVAGFNQQQSIIGKFLIGKFPKMMNVLAKSGRDLILSSPVVGVIISPEDNLETSINVGRLYERLALTATSLGINCTPLYAMIDDKNTVNQLVKLFNLKEAKPLFFFRLGFSKNEPYHTPRRNLSEFWKDDNETMLAKSMGISFKIDQLKVGKFTINYLEAGQGKPLLLLHGGNIGWGQWYPNIPELAKYFKVYAVDLVGGGRSSKIDFADLDFQKDLVDPILGFISQKKLRSLNILGSSIGGWIATKLLLEIPQKISNVIIADGVGFNESMRVADRIIGIYPLAKLLSKTALNPKRSNKNIEGFLRSVFFKSNISLKQEFIDYFYDTMLISHNLLFISRLSSPSGFRKELVLKSHLPKLSKKVLVIWGEGDKLMPFENCEENLKLIRDIQIKKIKEAGHIPSIEKSTEFNKLVIDFLKSN